MIRIVCGIPPPSLDQPIGSREKHTIQLPYKVPACWTPQAQTTSVCAQHTRLTVTIDLCLFTGPLSTDEKITAFAFAVTISLWIFGAQIGVNAVAAALLGLGILLITGVVEWKENLAQVTRVPRLQSSCLHEVKPDNCGRQQRRMTSTDEDL